MRRKNFEEKSVFEFDFSIFDDNSDNVSVFYYRHGRRNI